MKRSFLLLMIGLLAACGGAPAGSDGAPTSQPGGQPQDSTTQPTAGDSTAPAPTAPPTGSRGRATLTVDGEQYEFSQFTCLVGHDEAASLGAVYEDNSFVGYTGLVDGIQMRIWIYDMQGQGRLEAPADGPSIQSGWWAEVQADSTEDPNWAWIATNQLVPDNLSLRMDGALISGSGTFAHSGDGEPTAGTFEAECG